MEPHPVPQNILDVEFKLFGAFTLKQFGKILAGSLIGVGIFLINLNPLIKIPLVLISVFTGILLAIIPNFGVWLTGFLKALFISPRYVWEKKTVMPEILTSQAVADPEKDRNVTSALNKKKLDINELPLDKLFGTQTEQSKKVEPDKLDKDNGDLNKIYSDVFGVQTRAVSKPVNASPAPVETKAKMASIASEKPADIFESRGQVIVNPKFENVQDYQTEINRLKQELSSLTKGENFKEREEEIMSKINDLYREIKLINGGKLEGGKKTPVSGVMQSGIQGKVIYGIVVDKNDAPFPSVNIKFVNDSAKKIFSTVSGKDGKFSTVKELPQGNYAVFLESPGRQFHAYNIEVGTQNLPAYKLREK